MLRRVTSGLLIGAIALWSVNGVAAEARIAVASNFAAPAKALAQLFEDATPHSAQLSFASSGKFHAQIIHGAPFDVLLSADRRVPNALSESGLTVPTTQFTYALGKLVLWSIKSSDPFQQLMDGTYQKLSIANPRHAPYGHAAAEVLERLNISKEKWVLGENIAQAFQFVSSRNADLGFVAASQLKSVEFGSTWSVPGEYHAAIVQDAVLLNRGAENPAAIAFLAFIQTPKSKKVIESFGYETRR